MEAYRERIARRIQLEATRHGENAIDLAHAIGTHSSTVERWFRAERTPQRRHRKQLAEHWQLPLEALEPDLAAEERELKDQLDRIEEQIAEMRVDLAELGVDLARDEAQAQKWRQKAPGTESSADLGAPLRP